jgi:hypothetical protein
VNHKHIACLVILFLCVVIFQGVSMVRTRANAMQDAAHAAESSASTASLAWRTQRAILDDLKNKTADLIAYLDAWEPHLDRLSTPESGELNVNALVKQSGLILLAQRFELTPNKSDATVPGTANSTIPQLVRAHLTAEDDFVKSLTWLGELETKLPTSRVSSLEITRGQTGNDIRVELVVDIPLAVPRAGPSPTP